MTDALDDTFYEVQARRGNNRWVPQGRFDTVDPARKSMCADREKSRLQWRIMRFEGEDVTENST